MTTLLMTAGIAFTVWMAIGGITNALLCAKHNVRFTFLEHLGACFAGPVMILIAIVIDRAERRLGQ